MILWTEGLHSFAMLVTLIIHGQFNVITLAFDARFPLTSNQNGWEKN